MDFLGRTPFQPPVPGARPRPSVPPAPAASLPAAASPGVDGVFISNGTVEAKVRRFTGVPPAGSTFHPVSALASVQIGQPLIQAAPSIDGIADLVELLLNRGAVQRDDMTGSLLNTVNASRSARGMVPL